MSANPPSLSLLAAGIAGWAQLHEKLDGPDAAQAVDRCLKRVARAVESFEGRIVRDGGDEVIAKFDSAANALRAALEMQRYMADLAATSEVKMAIRVGVSCVPGGELPLQADEEALAREVARLVGIAKPGQSLATGKIVPALPETLRAQAVDTNLKLSGESGQSEIIVEIIDTAPAPAASPASEAGETPAAESGPKDVWLSLRYGENTLTLDEHHPTIDMGRDKLCDIVIRSGHASRRHATIKRRGDLVVLIDKSRNGTFVTMDGDAEQFVRQGECALYGTGVIAFAAPASAPDADCAHFECVEPSFADR